jgi:hypothetical protein
MNSDTCQLIPQTELLDLQLISSILKWNLRRQDQESDV